MTEALRIYPHAQPDADGTRARLRGASVTAGGILEPAEDDPRGRAEPAEITPAAPLRMAPVAAPVPPTVWRSRSMPGDGLRLMPLAALVWGGPVRGRLGLRTASPRVRGDHVLLMVSQGALAVELPRMRHPVTQGRLAFIPAGTAFSLDPPAEIQGWALLIPPSVARALSVVLPDAFRCGLPAEADRSLLEPTMNALGHGSPRSPEEEAATRCQLGLISVALSRLSSVAEPRDAANCRMAEARPLAQRFIDMMWESPAQDRTMAEIAADLGCSLAHLDRACQQSRGRRALELLYSVRSDRAAQLLRETDKPTMQIAAELGYSSLGHFMRAFAAATGRTPDSFRLNARKPSRYDE